MAARGGLAALLCCVAVCGAALLVEGRKTALGDGMSQADLNAIEILERVRSAQACSAAYCRCCRWPFRRAHLCGVPAADHHGRHWCYSIVLDWGYQPTRTRDRTGLPWRWPCRRGSPGTLNLSSSPAALLA